jgi:hypothetical protein
MPIVLAVPGSLDNRDQRRFHLLLSKRLHLLPPFFLFNEPGTALVAMFEQKINRNFYLQELC